MKYKLLLLLFLLPVISQAQRSKIGLLINTTGGGNLNIQNSSKDGLTNLIYYNCQSAYLKLAVSTFFQEKLGVEFSFQSDLTYNNNYNGFKSMIESKHPDCYVHYKFKTNNTYSSETSTNKTLLLLGGISYKFQYKKFHFIPKFLTGAMEYKAVDAEVYLKRKNSNDYFTITYLQNSDQNLHYSFILNTGVNIMYFVYRGLGINFEVNYLKSLIHLSPVKYQVTTRNETLGAQSQEDFHYNQPLSQLRFGAGICYYFKFGRSRLQE